MLWYLLIIKFHHWNYIIQNIKKKNFYSCYYLMIKNSDGIIIVTIAKVIVIEIIFIMTIYFFFYPTISEIKPFFSSSEIITTNYIKTQW